jgi:imidazolonepropionase
MKSDLVIFNIGQLVTCASNGKPKRSREMRDVGLIANGAIAVADGKFVGVGKSDDIRQEFQAEKVIDAGGRVVCPGFVDPHTHIVYAGDRLDEFELKIDGANYLEILSRGGGILSTVEKTRVATIEALIESGRQRLDKMLACGTTTCEIKTGYGLDTDTELKMLQVIEGLDKTHPITIVPTFLAAHAIPYEFTDDTDAYVELICEEMLPRARVWYEDSHFNGQVPFFADVYCERNAFSLELSARVLQAARRIGFPLKAHVDQFTNLGGSRTSIGLGAASIDHLDATSSDEIKLLAASDTIGVMTPAANFNHGATVYADARKMIDGGCALALSTDYNPGSAPCPSQPMAMAIACRYQKLLPAEAMNAATINAAYAIGLGDKVGSIEVGKQADILLVDTNDYRDVAYEFGIDKVATVLSSGAICFDKKR